MDPRVYIIAGPNGAGKTTFAQEFLPRYAACTNFVNADLIAQGVSPFTPAAAAFRAGRLMIQEIEVLAKRRVDFGFEATLSGRTQLTWIRDLKQCRYSVHLFFLWVPTVDLALSRVKGRVMRGGHDIPSAVVRRRFERSISNFFRYYRAVVDTWILFDNSADRPVVMASAEEKDLRIIRKELYDDLIVRYLQRS